MRLYQLAGGNCGKTCCGGGSGKVFVSSEPFSRSKKKLDETAAISKPPPVNPISTSRVVNMEELQAKLNALSTVKTTRHGKQIKRFVGI